MAIAAPTLISCPPVAAVTSVMPIARIASSEPLSRIVMRYPDKTGFPALLFPSVIPKKDGSMIRLNTVRRSSAMIGINIWCLARFPNVCETLDLFFCIILCHLLRSYP